MALSHGRRLDQLPAELLHEMVRYLDFKSLQNLSRVSRLLRYSTIPRLFQRISVPFLASGIDILNEVVGSPLAKVVKTVKFRVLPHLKNEVCAKYNLRRGVVQPFERIYPRRLYELHRDTLGHMTYEEISENMCALYEDQAKLLMSGHGLPSLTTILQLLPALEELVLCWVVFSKETPILGWVVFSKETPILGRILKFCTQNDDICLKRLLAAACKAISMRPKENPIISLQVFAMGMSLTPNYYSLSDRNLQEAFVTIRRLHIGDYNSLLRLLEKNIDMPALGCLKLTGFRSIELILIESVCKKTMTTLSDLHIESRCLYYKGKHYGGPIQVFDRDIVTFFYTIGQYMSLEKVHVRIPDYQRRYARQFESLLLGRISLSANRLFKIFEKT